MNLLIFNKSLFSKQYNCFDALMIASSSVVGQNPTEERKCLQKINDENGNMKRLSNALANLTK